MPIQSQNLIHNQGMMRPIDDPYLPKKQISRQHAAVC